MNAGLGLMAGLFLGVAFVVMRERADRTLQEPGDLAYYLQVPELGIIPSAAAKDNLHSGYFQRRKKVTAAAKLIPDAAMTTVDGKTHDDCVELVTWQHKPSVAAEAFRLVLTSILFTGKNGDRPRVLVLTSASPSEGKSTVISNLAIALAEIKQRVLVIDADMRKPRQHTIFDVSNERGLSTLLEERPLMPATLEGVVQESSVPGLFVLTSGPATRAASSLLFSGNMAELLAKFKAEFDMVLIDTPPMLQMPDARVVGRMADAVILVARAGHTTREAAVAARGRLVEDDTRVLGTILNDWNPKMSPGGYYGYYKGYSYRGYYGKYGHE
jgi:capsular exopolysaccharide synthesis family protein